MAIAQGHRRKLRWDRLIAKGYGVEKIAQRVGRSHQRISQYIQETGQHESWRECRNKALPLTKKEQQEILSGLEQRIAHLAEKGGWESQKAVEYMRKVPATRYCFQELVDLFKFYRIAKETDIKLSLEALEVEGMTYNSISRILHAVGLEPMYGRYDKRILEDFRLKRERIRACFDLPLSAVDIQYFTGVRHLLSIHQYFRQKGKRLCRRNPIKTFVSDLFAKGVKRNLTYKLASQIYECLDVGFTVEETKEYCQTSEMIIDYAQGHRNEIQPVIVEALRRLYQENITTPHRPKYGLEHLLQQDWKDQAIARAYQRTNWNATTVAYFVDLTPNYVLQQFWKQGGGRRKKVLEKKSERLSEHAASQIYQLQDRGKNPQQIAQALHIKKNRVEHALQHRQRYAPMIMEGLHKIFPDQEIITPYLPGKNL